MGPPAPTESPFSCFDSDRVHPNPFFQQAYAFTLDCCRRRQATVLTLRPSAHHHKLCFGKFDTHDPTLPLVLEVRAIRAPHQDEPRIGQCRWGGWVIRAFAPRQTTTPMLPFERKASPSCIGRAVIVNSRISCFAGTVTLSLNGRCRTADRDQKVMRKGLHLSRCSKRSTLRLVHDAFHLRTVDPGDDETGWRSDRGWREISEHAALF